MSPNDAALALATILQAENDALERHDPEAAVALTDRKLAVAKALSADSIDPELADRLRQLANANRILLERAIDVQSRIITMVARAAAQALPPVARYGAEGRPLPSDTSLSITRHA